MLFGGGGQRGQGFQKWGPEGIKVMVERGRQGCSLFSVVLSSLSLFLSLLLQFLEAEQIEDYVQRINKSKEEETERRKTKKPSAATSEAATS